MTAGRRRSAGRPERDCDLAAGIVADGAYAHFFRDGHRDRETMSCAPAGTATSQPVA